MRKNNMIKIIYVLMAAAAIMCAAVIGWVAAEPEAEQTTAEPFETTPLVINTVERQDDIVLTVIRDNGDTVFQYAGDIELWKAADGKAYGIIYLDEEVLQ